MNFLITDLFCINKCNIFDVLRENLFLRVREAGEGVNILHQKSYVQGFSTINFKTSRRIRVHLDESKLLGD